jgi:hypothetical protein
MFNSPNPFITFVHFVTRIAHRVDSIEIGHLY